VEQTGTEADCHGGAAAYQGWFEMFPNAPVFYDNPVQPGDAMNASVVSADNAAIGNENPAA
jgi:Peptidase A4 family